MNSGSSSYCASGAKTTTTRTNLHPEEEIDGEAVLISDLDVDFGLKVGVELEVGGGFEVPVALGDRDVVTPILVSTLSAHARRKRFPVPY